VCGTPNACPKNRTVYGAQDTSPEPRAHENSTEIEKLVVARRLLRLAASWEKERSRCRISERVEDLVVALF
jgi:hypothetical protein